jgi:hypothetical protein
MLSVCFVSFVLVGKPDVKPEIYMLPNCAPRNTGNMICARVDKASPYSRDWVVCKDKDGKVVHTGPAYLQKET